MTLRDLVDKLLGRQPASASTARDRLQLVLAHDRSDLSPELLDQMRREIFEVVAKYVDIDLEEGDVSLETEDRVTALVANLPFRRPVSSTSPKSELGEWFWKQFQTSWLSKASPPQKPPWSNSSLRGLAIGPSLPGL